MDANYEKPTGSVNNKFKEFKKKLFGDPDTLDDGVLGRLAWEFAARLADASVALAKIPAVSSVGMDLERQFGWPKFGRSFSMFQPAYHEALGNEVLNKLKCREDITVLELGIMARQSAKDFLHFSQSLNPQAKANIVDINLGMLKWSKTEGANFLQADVLSLPLANSSQDLVLGQGILQNLIFEDQEVDFSNQVVAGEKVVDSIVRVLKPGGVALLVESDNVLGASQELINLVTSKHANLKIEVVHQITRISDPKDFGKWTVDTSDLPTKESEDILIKITK